MRRRTDEPTDDVENIHQRQGRDQLRELNADPWSSYGVADWADDAHLQERNQQREVEALTREESLRKQGRLSETPFKAHYRSGGLLSVSLV